MKRVLVIGAVLSSFVVLAAPSPCAAQDTHYWNNQYGPRSMLLGGAVVGSVSDMSATYYNPGALGYITEPELLLSANAYQIESLKVQDGGGEGIDLSTTQFNLLPNMLAGAFRKSWLGDTKLAYSFLTRHRFDAEIKGAATDRFDILPDPGEEDFAGAIRSEVNAKELWAGLTVARAVNPTVGVGVTTYVSIRSEGGLSETFAQALTDSSDISLLFDLDNFSSSVYSLLWKAGVGLNFSPLTLGLTVTTPNVRLFGSGEATFNQTVVRVDVDGDNIPDNGFATNFQEDVTANYHSPWSVAFGAGYFFDTAQIHVSAEWYGSVDAYDVLELSDFASQATGEIVERSLRQKRDSVTNFAVGIQKDLGQKYGGFVSFNTDNSAFHPESDISVTAIDIYHGTIGATAAIGRTNWMLGISHSRGDATTTQAIDLQPEDGAALDPGRPVDIVYSRTTLMIGFRVGL